MIIYLHVLYYIYLIGTANFLYIFFMSLQPYLRYKTIDIVNRDCINIFLSYICIKLSLYMYSVITLLIELLFQQYSHAHLYTKYIQYHQFVYTSYRDEMLCLLSIVDYKHVFAYLHEVDYVDLSFSLQQHNVLAS